MNYLTKEFIIRANRRAVNKYGGNFIEPHNFLHEDRLDYLLEWVHYDDYYPTLDIKAAFYFFKLAGSQIFNDGNKRTGLAAALTFLNINGVTLQRNLQIVILNEKFIPQPTASTPNKILENLSLEIATNKLDIPEIADFIAKNRVPFKP